jgi:hypothetical protein
MSEQAFSVISIFISILVFLAILIVGWRTDLLKEGNMESKPYSFHKFQLWLWTLIICPSFALYWGRVSGHQPDINVTGLVLLGISGGTTAVAQIINTSQKANPVANPLLKSLTVLTTGFWSDILKDDTGQLSIGRLQQLIFTFIYIGIYIFMFFPEMKYPIFEQNSFVLMGISTGTYLIGKGMNK